jgi:hypothetical protein
MAPDSRLDSDRFPRSTMYHPDWVLTHAIGGANSLWLMDWLTERMALKPGMHHSLVPREIHQEAAASQPGVSHAKSSADLVQPRPIQP